MQQLCFGLIFVFFCQQSDAPQVKDSFCELYRPIKVARTDDPRTKRAVLAANKKWKRLCDDKRRTGGK